MASRSSWKLIDRNELFKQPEDANDNDCNDIFTFQERVLHISPAMSFDKYNIKKFYIFMSKWYYKIME